MGYQHCSMEPGFYPCDDILTEGFNEEERQKGFRFKKD